MVAEAEAEVEVEEEDREVEAEVVLAELEVELEWEDDEELLAEELLVVVDAEVVVEPVVDATAVAPEMTKALEKLMLAGFVLSTISKLYWPLLTLVGMLNVAIFAEAGTVVNSIPAPGVTTLPWVRRMVTSPLLGLDHVIVNGCPALTSKPPLGTLI